MPTKKNVLCDLTDEDITTYFLPLLPKPKRGFESELDPLFLFQCFRHKLKTGCQWKFIFPDIVGVTYPCSHESVYYFFNRWSKLGIFEQAFKNLLQAKAALLSPTQLNVDGTHTSAKKGVRLSRIRVAKRPVLVI